ncbi:MAG: hypothetical protein HON98_07070 [Chloroflexi bacterium]|jgi:hypothetical protein|nr:hypothetical protein [Chloroflexota bacterium]MBT3669704.1 hypothetical protein [Chloroflexota bacterium]MBT4002808.1 hypothetical protein [Chloroflexota bacterium]MBT4305642.1 hypothetical protein [Chloroflexota bacterium]MBT4533799.1 hypothetical protein [Chloroflexota bacterium]
MRTKNTKDKIIFVKKFIEKYKKDIGVVLILSICSGIIYFNLSNLINPEIFEYKNINTWFESDIPRNFLNMTSRLSNHHRTSVHPLFPLFAYSPGLVFRKIFNFSLINTVRLVNTTYTMIWAGLFYLLFRIKGLKKIDSSIITILALVSSSAIFWMTVPESFLLGSISIIFMLIIAALAEKRFLGTFWYTVGSFLTFSITVTNWMVGLLISFIHNKFSNFIKVSLYAFSTVLILWKIQNFFIPSTKLFLLWEGEKNYFNNLDIENILLVIKSFFIHSMVMPSISYMDNSSKSYTSIQMTIQNSSILPDTWLEGVSILLWIVILSIGVINFFSIKMKTKFQAIIGILILGQLILHILYGSETFLYSLNFLPLIIILASYSFKLNTRKLSLGLIAILIIVAGINNYNKFNIARNLYEPTFTPRQITLNRMKLSPEDPWPRGEGHTILALPGSLDTNKAFSSHVTKSEVWDIFPKSININQYLYAVD